MAFKSYYNNGNSYYGQSNGGGYQRRGNYNNQNNGGYRQNKSNKKHSGARQTTTKKGGKAIVGWNYSKAKGLVSVACFESKFSKEIENKRGDIYTKLVAYLEYKATGHKRAMSAFVSHRTGKCYIPEMQWVLNPKAPNGGYCGTFKVKN